MASATPVRRLRSSARTPRAAPSPSARSSSSCRTRWTPRRAAPGRTVGVDAEDEGRVDALSRRRQDDLVRPRLEMAGRVLPAAEPAGRLDHDVGADGRPVEVGRVALGRRPDPPPVDDERVAVHLDRPGYRPNVESYLSRWASIATSTTSLTPTTSMSRSRAARTTRRPIRPNPLTPIRTVISALSRLSDVDSVGDEDGQCACRSTCWLTDPRSAR